MRLVHVVICTVDLNLKQARRTSNNFATPSNSGPVKARPSDFEFAVHEISTNNGELAEELEEFGIF